jgi:hypothetical protein
VEDRKITHVHARRRVGTPFPVIGAEDGSGREIYQDHSWFPFQTSRRREHLAHMGAFALIGRQRPVIGEFPSARGRCDLFRQSGHRPSGRPLACTCIDRRARSRIRVMDDRRFRISRPRALTMRIIRRMKSAGTVRAALVFSRMRWRRRDWRVIRRPFWPRLRTPRAFWPPRPAGRSRRAPEPSRRDDALCAPRNYRYIDPQFCMNRSPPAR